MLSPLKPLLCRHDFYWSERHRSERCRRCGKRQAVEIERNPADQPVAGLTDLTPPRVALDGLSAFAPVDGTFIDFQEPAPRRNVRSPGMIRPSAKVLKAQAWERREMLLARIDNLIDGQRPSREEAIDAVLAVIEDAHSAEPVLFGQDAAGHFARLHEARTAPRC